MAIRPPQPTRLMDSDLAAYGQSIAPGVKALADRLDDQYAPLKEEAWLYFRRANPRLLDQLAGLLRPDYHLITKAALFSRDTGLVQIDSDQFKLVLALARLALAAELGHFLREAEFMALIYHPDECEAGDQPYFGRRDSQPSDPPPEVPDGQPDA